MGAHRLVGHRQRFHNPSYYAVVGGWVLHYVYLSLINSFAGKSAEQVTDIFINMTVNLGLQIFWLAIFMLVMIVIVSKGVFKRPRSRQ
jgi:NSS family neurotransmitter:Na+ symporter